jgi:uncharacterized SAM-binding protein YcdF (DUF218 family)
MAALLFIASLVAAVVLAARRRRRKWTLAAPPALVLLALLVTWSGFVAQKWLARLVMPVGLLWLALFAFALWLFYRRERAAAAAALVLFVGYTLAGNEVLGSKLVSLLENDHPRPPHPNEPYDAIAVLGGGTNQTPDDQVQLGASGDRLITAARLFRHGDAKLLVATGVSEAGVSSSHARDLSGEARALWLELGIPDSAIVAIGEGRNTSEEMEVLARLSRERGWSRVGLLTSAWHLPRAIEVAGERALTVVPLPADYRGGKTMLSVVQVVPCGNGFEQTELAAWEMVGRIVR